MSRQLLSCGLLLVAPSCVSQGVETLSIEEAIIGGETATPAEFPTVVALENGPGNWFCTGTLIDKDWVLTAAHCIDGETAAGMKIRFDDANINDTTGGKVVAVAELHGHPSYDGIAWNNDIALVKLAESVTDREVTPIHREPVAAATSVTEVGYGDADNNGGGAGLLRKLITPTVDCTMANDPEISGANLVCFNGADGTASCYGDSGGPAFITLAGKLRVAGITSGGTDDICTAGWDLYTSVAGELAFIDAVMAGLTPEPDPDPAPEPEPDPDPIDPKTGDDSGCNTGGGSGGLLLVGCALVLAARRARRQS